MQAQIFMQTLQFIFKWGGRIMPGLTGFLAFQLFATPPRPKRKPHHLLASGETTTLYHNNKTLKVYRWQPNRADQAPTVMLIHGWGGSAQSWRAMIDPLLQAGFGVITFDGPAHGASTGKRTNLVEFSACMRVIADSVGPLHAIVGHSFGGMVTGYVLANQNTPPHLKTVEHLVLISTPNTLTDILDRFGTQLQLPPQTLANLVQRIETIAGQSIDTFSTARCLAQQNIPTLVIHDTQDKEIPYPDAQAIAGRLPRAQLLTTQGLGHRRIIRAPLVVEAVVNFLDQKN